MARHKHFEMLAPELGHVGLKQYGGYVREEFLKDLQGIRGVRIYKEMRDNSAVIGAALNAIEMLTRQVSWSVEPPDQATDEEKGWAERLTQSLDDMSTPWAETVADHLSMLPFGFAPSEMVFKRCEGETDEPDTSSKFDDAVLVLAKVPLRPQETIERWAFAPNGTATGLWQRPPTDSTVRWIPDKKLLNFRAKTAGGNPEGRSVLRNAYFQWYFAKRIQELEGIGIERDLAGLPVFRIPAECMVSGASAEQASVFDMAKEIVQTVRNDDEAGLVIPSAFMDGQQLYEFKLLSTGGTRAVDTSKIIERLERRIAQTLLADFILLGHEGVGSFSLSEDKTKLFAVALGGWLDVIADLYNAKAIPLLCRLNGYGTDRCPKLVHGDLEKQNLAAWGDFVNKMVGARVITPDDDLEDAARHIAEIRRRNPNAKPRAAPMPTNTKPDGGAPDKPKPPESNPGPAPEDE